MYLFNVAFKVQLLQVSVKSFVCIKKENPIIKIIRGGGLGTLAFRFLRHCKICSRQETYMFWTQPAFTSSKRTRYAEWQKKLWKKFKVNRKDTRTKPLDVVVFWHELLDSEAATGVFTGKQLCWSLF